MPAEGDQQVMGAPADVRGEEGHAHSQVFGRLIRQLHGAGTNKQGRETEGLNQWDSRAVVGIKEQN